MMEDVLVQWGMLEAGWDGGDSPAINPVCLTKLQWVLNLIEKRDLPEPKLFIAGDGEIGINYRDREKDQYADICILADHTMLSYVHRGSTVLFEMVKTVETVEEHHLEAFFKALEDYKEG